MKTGLIYKITNTLNGNAYIGQTVTTLENRWAQHLRDAKNPNKKPAAFGRALKKYPKEVFSLEIIVQGVPDYFLNAFEMYWINYYNTYRKGYNSTLGGDGTVGATPWNRGIPTPDHVRAKQSEAAKKRPKATNMEQLRLLAMERTGFKHSNSKHANVYNYYTEELIAEDVALTEWCRENGYNQGNVCSTARGVVKQAKGIYAVYI